MGKSAAEVRSEIVRTRDELGETIMALEERIGETRESVVDRVSPSRIWQRKTAGLRSRVDHVGASISRSTHAVTGSVADAQASVSEQTATTTERTGELMARTKLKDRGTAQAENNPMAAGLVALGVGFLAATLLPPTERERQAAERLQKGLVPIKEQASSIGREIGGELQQSAQGSVELLKDQAAEAVERVKQDAQEASEEVKEEAQQATMQVKGRARRASRQVKQTATEKAPASASRPRVARPAGTSPPKAPVRRARSSST